MVALFYRIKLIIEGLDNQYKQEQLMHTVDHSINEDVQKQPRTSTCAPHKVHHLKSC